MIEKTIKDGKKSLESILRKKAFKEVEEHLKNKGIDINIIDKQDLEALVEAKFKENQNILEGVVRGGAFAVLLDAII